MSVEPSMDELADYDYELPTELIAQEPVANRAKIQQILKMRKMKLTKKMTKASLPQ